jgi:cell division protein FtsB
MSWRALVLGCIIALAAALVLPSLRVYFDQQQELASLRAERDAAKAEVEDLTAEIARWDDPAFIIAQARERLAYVFPGETPYRVVDPEFVTASAPDSAAGIAQSDPMEGVPWYEGLWGSVLTVGEEPSSEATVPEETSTEETEQLTPVDFGG